MRFIGKKGLGSIFCAVTALSSFQSAVALADSCEPLVQDLINWNNTAEAGYTHFVGFTMASSARPARWTGSLSGQLRNAPGGVLASPRPSAQYFSDRFARSGDCSGLCFDTQPFAVNKADQTTVSVNTANQLTIVLNTWGNSTYVLNSSCFNGFMYATQDDGFHVLSFVKNKSAIIH